ncbi:MAG: flagellar hook-length control protein FliK [Planctomycetota bacterium]
MGKEIQQLVDQINTVLRSASPPVQSELRTAQDRLLSQLFGSTTLEQPEQLAQQLADRLGQWARGLEGAVSRELTLAPRTDVPIQGTGFTADLPEATPTSISTPLDRPQAAATPANSPTVLVEGNVPAESGAVATNGDAKVQSSVGHLPQVIRGTFDGDLKGQLLELRTHLESLAANRQEVPQAIQQAITRVDSMLQQVTAQQVRNLQGLNQYLYAELPVDPRTGIQEARLQVFYRNQGSTPKTKDPDRFTVALFLNLSKLGDVSAVVSGVDRAVTVGFSVEDPKVASMLEGQSQLLRDSLVRSGHAGATVTVRHTTKEDVQRSGDDPLWSQFLEIQPKDGDPGSRLNAEA